MGQMAGEFMVKEEQDQERDLGESETWENAIYKASARYVVGELLWRRHISYWV